MANDQLNTMGYTVIENVFSPAELDAIAHQITRANSSRPAFRKTADVFAIRQFLKELPQLQGLVFNLTLQSLVTEHAGPDFFVVKSIYFDKPENSNWFVAWHQDLTISVDKKIDLPGFGPWTTKQDQFAVQPPLRYLENIVTVRIHLDDTDEHNGALRVIPGSHRKGIYRNTPDDATHPDAVSTKTTCRVKKGGVMFMHPLLRHASNRNTNGNRRRVIHIELSSLDLPVGLAWAEKMSMG
jgi:ectoine hydroxylase-related dioxygenase (phytanoyl-CoA dioxygenase family)